MKVAFLQSGGFAGLLRGCELDTAELPAAEAVKLRAMVEASGLRAGKSAPPPGARDLIGYEIRIETDDGELTAAFDDASVPAEAEPLLAYLRKRSTPRPPA
jgi:Emfourin